MKKRYEISVVIPMYNRERYIGQTISSIMAQTFKDFEIVIVDDGSTDRSYDICEAFSKQYDNVKVLRHTLNRARGGGPARFTGVSAASGKYIQIVDSDDVLLPDALRQMHEVAEKMSADIVHTVVRLQPLEENGSVIRPGGKFVMLRHDWGNHRFINEPTLIPYNPEERVREYLSNVTFVDLQYKLYNRDFLFNNDMEFAGYFFHLESMMKAKRLVKVGIPTYIWRQNPISETRKRRTKEDVCTIIDNLVNMTSELDKVVKKIDYLKDKIWLQEIIKMDMASAVIGWRIDRHGFYNGGISPELYKAIGAHMKKYTGGGTAWLMAYLFHLANARAFGYSPSEYFKKAYLKGTPDVTAVP